MNLPRLQLSMFLTGEAAGRVEGVRRRVDPVQQGLIPAHVTLCRDDELEALETMEHELASGERAPLVLTFGRVEALGEHGLLLVCTAGVEQFQALRERLLRSKAIRALQPHITLAHPRNPRAPGNVPGAASALALPLTVTLPAVRVIRQENGQPWETLRSHELTSPRR